MVIRSPRILNIFVPLLFSVKRKKKKKIEYKRKQEASFLYSLSLSKKKRSFPLPVFLHHPGSAGFQPQPPWYSLSLYEKKKHASATLPVAGLRPPAALRALVLSHQGKRSRPLFLLPLTQRTKHLTKWTK